MKKILFVFTLSLILAATGYVFSAGYYGTTSGGSTEGLTLGTNSTLTVADSVAANITAPFGSGAFADTYTGTGVNITATTANITTLTAATANITGGNVTGITNLGAANATLTGANVTTLNAVTPTFTGVLGANVINASGTLTAVPSATAPIMFGNTTPVNTSTGATFPTATKTQISKAGAFTNAAVGDLIIVTGGTGATTGQYRLTTKTSNDLVVVDRNIHASGTDITDGAFTVYKDVVTISQTDGTNGQMLTGWSHTNKPLQLGGSNLLASSGATSRDIVLGGHIYNGTGLAISLSGSNGLYLGNSTTNRIFFDFYVTNGIGFMVDNTMDLGGATGVYRPRHIYLGGAAITSGTGTGVTVNSSGNVAQQVYKVTTTYAAYSDTDTTKGIVIATLPAKTRLVAAYADTTAAYTGGTVSAATLEVGVTAEGGAEILAAHNVLAGAILAGDTDAEMGTSMTRAAKEQGAYMPSFTGTTAVYATIDTTDGNLNALTAGSTTFYLVTERLP